MEEEKAMIMIRIISLSLLLVVGILTGRIEHKTYSGKGSIMQIKLATTLRRLAIVRYILLLACNIITIFFLRSYEGALVGSILLFIFAIGDIRSPYWKKEG